MIERLIAEKTPFLLVITEELFGTSYSIIVAINRQIQIIEIHPLDWSEINRNVHHLILKKQTKSGVLYDYCDFISNISARMKFLFLKKL